jgi:hypothetical protein
VHNLVHSPSSSCFSEEGHSVSFSERVIDADLVARIEMEEVLPSELHLFSAGKAVASRIRKSMVLGHESAQRIGI